MRPRKGADKAYDALCERVVQVQARLEKMLQDLKKQFPNVAMKFVHKAFRYEIEVAETALPEQFMRQIDVTKKCQGVIRFHTANMKEPVAELERLEEKIEDSVFPFISELFKEFYKHQAQFRAAVRLLAELDVFLSMAVASQNLAGVSCRPEIVDVQADNQGEPASVLEIKGCRHPVAAAKMGTAFVPNDTLMNASGVPGVIVVTGPNMGGKSTVLRQTCLAVVMAQLGCRVNASFCRLSPMDRIFTRIGSYDMLLEGKSTLLTELEESAAILLHGTRRSLAVLDELGRGTSTFDGAAIAAAVLADLTRRIRCCVLFATHYHPVSKQASAWPEVAPFHMAAEVDETTQDMTFLYRFLPGLCPASHGHNVARLAGLPAGVLEDARARSAEFERGEIAGGAELLRQTEAAATAGDEKSLRQIFRASRQASAGA